MQRREFFTLIGGAAASRPLAAHAQQAGRLPTIGYLGTATPATQGQWVAAFVQRLRELGWIEGRTVAIEYRWAESRSERFACVMSPPDTKQHNTHASACPQLTKADMRVLSEGFGVCRVGPGNFTPSLSQIRT